MRYDSRVVPVPATAATEGAPMNVSSLREMRLQVAGAFTAQLNLMGQAHGPRPDGTGAGPWLQVGVTITAPGWVEIPGVYHALRLDTGTYTSAPSSVVLAGLNHRGE